MKKYFIEEEGKKSGPYDVYELKDIGIKAGTQISTIDDVLAYDAESFPELLHIIEKNPKKKINYERERFFGYRLAGMSDRWLMHLKSRLMALPFGILLAALLIFLRIDLRKDTFTSYVILILIFIVFVSYKIFSIIKFSSPHGGENSKLKLISSENGEFIHEIAKKDFNRALNIALKYTFLPEFENTGPKNPQTYAERKAGVYLVKNEGRGNNPE